jgi:AAA+ ATPase superfamily predicted ATPase
VVSVLIAIPKREGKTSLLEERFNILKHNDIYGAYVSLVKRMGYQCPMKVVIIMKKLRQ